VYILFIIIIWGILVLFIYITRLASNEIFTPSNKIHREVGQAKDLSAPLYYTELNVNRFLYGKDRKFIQQIWNNDHGKPCLTDMKCIVGGED
jgi:hypothetical protein